MGGEKLGWPILSPPRLVKASTLPCHEYAYTLAFLGIGKNWAGPFFPHPEKWKHQHCADGYLVGGKLGRPILSPSRQVKASTLPSHEYANTHWILVGGEQGWCLTLSGREKMGLPSFPHPLTSKGYICIHDGKVGCVILHPINHMHKLFATR